MERSWQGVVATESDLTVAFLTVLGDPTFDVPLLNVTVVAGQTAVLPCSIEHLGKYKVVWVDSLKNVLTYEDRRVTDDWRFSVVRPYVREWNLQIRDVTWDDQGQYRCTINTSVVKKKVVSLYVKVPAKIIAELSTSDITVVERDAVVLTCNVTGIPRPEVTWIRRTEENGLEYNVHRSQCNARARVPGQAPGMTMVGEVIVIENVSRECDGYYECVASNGVPPAVTRKIQVTVEFPPEVRVLNRRISQELGKDTILQCSITAFPHAYNAWQKNGADIGTTHKHQLEAFEENKRSISLRLTIRQIELSDYGEYRCVAANAHGNAEAITYLDQFKPHRVTTTAKTLRVISLDKDNGENVNQPVPNPKVDYQQTNTDPKMQNPWSQNQVTQDIAKVQESKANHGGTKSHGVITVPSLWLYIVLLTLLFHQYT